MKNETRLQTVQMLARRFKPYGLSSNWFKAEAEAGRIPCFKAGRRFLFDAEAVEAALIKRAAHAAKGGTDAN